MKRHAANLFAFALICALIVSFLPGHPARAAATIIAQWTFESPNTPAAATAAVYPNAIPPAVGSGNAGGVHTSASTAWSTPVGNGSPFSFSSNYWSVGNYYQFRTSTAGFTGISVSWDQTGSGTGPRDFKLAYSTDGTSFTDFSSYSLPNVTWSSGSTSLATRFSRDLSAITALDNQPNVYFRLIDTSTVSINGGTVGTAGTGRVDNFTVSGTGDQAPYVASTVPANGATDVPVSSNITINFSEPVNVTGSWFSLVCATSGTHAATVTGGPTSFVIDPGTDFVMGESCTLTIYAANVNDLDLIDPPDNMVVNFTAGFTTVTPPLPIGTVNGPVLDTDDGTVHVSPYVGQTVKIQGVIYEKTLQAISNSTNTYKGFFIQNTLNTVDGDPNTSDGLFVFMSTASTIGGYTPTVGDEVILTGKVSEYYSMTELVSPFTVVSVLRTGVDIDAEVPPVVANPPVSLADANRYWERLQGMRVQVPQNSVVLGGRNVFSPADAEIWVAAPNSTVAQRAGYDRKAYRDAHPLDDNYDPLNWDGNGYRILMGSLGIKALVGDGQALIAPARAYSTLDSAVAGGLNYTYSKYRIEVSAQPNFTEVLDPAANNPPTVFDRSIHYTIADYNLENLYDYRDNPFSGCDFTGNSGCSNGGTPYIAAVTPPYDYVPASDAAYQARLNDISLEIINNLHSPDILMVQEVENQDICTVTGGALTCGATDNADGKPDVLQELALKIAANGGPDYDAAWDRDSSDLRGIAPSFMYRTDRVQLLSPVGDPVLGTTPTIDGYASVPYDGDVSNPKTLNAVYSGTGACETSWVFPRAPDVALFRIYSAGIGAGSHRDVYVINNHFKSGPDTCVAHRTEQAKYNAALVAFIQAANPNARIVVGGDLNVYPRPDDPFAPIGQPTSSDQLGSLYNPSLGLKNLWEVLLGQAPEAAYSYVYLGMAQTLDQMFVTQPMLADLTQIRIAHINSDFPADYPDDVARGTSDHDPNVATFLINDPPTVDAGGPYTVNEGSSVTLTATGTDPEGQPLTYAWDLDNNGTFETPGQDVFFTGFDGPATLTVNVRVTDNGGLTAVASATVTVNNIPPTATFNSPASVNEGSTFSLSLTNPVDVPADLGSLQYAFDCGSGYGAFGASNTVSCPTVDNGILNVGGKVMDKDGGVNEYTSAVTVNNVAPTATFNAPASVNEGSNFTLSLTSPVDVPADLGSLQYAFNCGNGYGAFGTANTTSCPAADNGTLNVGGKVMDKDGGVSEYTAHVTIKNVAPTATFNAPASVNEGSNFTLSLTSPVDVPADLGSLQYAFNCGSGYGAFGTANTASCPAADNGTLNVGGKVMDKDGGVSEYTAHVTIKNVPPTVATPVITPEPSKENASVTASATFSDPGVNDAPFTCFVNYGDGSGDLTGSVSGATCTGPAHVYATFGSYKVTISVTDKDGGKGSNTATHVVVFNWSGFFSPVDNLPIWNSNKAGSAVPIKFSLGGNKGLNIFAAGYPQSVQVACDTGSIIGAPLPTINPGGSSLSYGDGQYNYVWKTDKSWAGTCRQLVVTLVDGTTHFAFFMFK